MGVAVGCGVMVLGFKGGNNGGRDNSFTAAI